MPEKFDEDEVIDLAEEHGWAFAGFDAGQGRLVRLERPDAQGQRILMHVWCVTGTVGSYLDHPRQGKTQLFRRNVTWSNLKNLLANPRVHTGHGYQRRPRPARATTRSSLDDDDDDSDESTFPCPGCGKLYRNVVNTVQHFESGRCPGCQGQENAGRAVYNYTRQQEQHLGQGRVLTTDYLRLTDGSEVDEYQPSMMNYKCPGCSKPFGQLGSMMQHVAARPQCQEAPAAYAMSNSRFLLGS